MIRLLAAAASAAVFLSTSPDAEAAPRHSTHNPWYNDHCVTNDPIPSSNQPDPRLRWSSDPNADTWRCYMGGSAAYNYGSPQGTLDGGSYDCEATAGTAEHALDACDHFWSQCGLTRNHWPQHPDSEFWVDEVCVPTGAGQQPLAEWVCVSQAHSYGTTRLSEVGPVTVEAPGEEAARWTATWDFPRHGSLIPSLYRTSCFNKSSAGANVPPGPDAVLWTCGEKLSDTLPNTEVYASSSSEAYARAIVEWQEFGFPSVAFDDVLCRPGSGDIGWQCTALLTDGDVASPIYHEAPDYSTAREIAQNTWAEMGYDNIANAECSPAGNTQATGADVDWYCVGDGEGEACDLPPLEMAAPSDEYPDQIRNLAWTYWKSQGYEASYASVNCSTVPSTTLPFWPAFMCEDRTGSVPAVSSLGRSESEALAIAMDLWNDVGAGVYVEDAACWNAVTPKQDLCTANAALIDYAVCKGLGYTKNGMEDLPELYDISAPNLPAACTKAEKKWRKMGKDPVPQSCYCSEKYNPTETTSWKCHGKDKNGQTMPIGGPYEESWEGAAAAAYAIDMYVKYNYDADMSTVGCWIHGG